MGYGDSPLHDAYLLGLFLVCLLFGGSDRALLFYEFVFFFFSSDLDILLATAWKWAIVG